jgi:hypothetical protein
MKYFHSHRGAQERDCAAQRRHQNCRASHDFGSLTPSCAKQFGKSPEAREISGPDCGYRLQSLQRHWLIINAI